MSWVDDIFNCKICSHKLNRPTMQTCGHSFCESCITYHLKQKQECPSCGEASTFDQMRTNHTLENILNESQLSLQKLKPHMCGTQVKPVAKASVLSPRTYTAPTAELIKRLAAA